jgi:uncharacterized protein YciI
MSATKKDDAAPPGRPSKSGEPPPAWSMRTYVVTFLYRGPNRVTDERAADELQRGHLAHMSRLHEEGKLILAGPFRDDGDLRGIGVFDSESVDEVRALWSEDPAVKAGTLRIEVRLWYSAKGIGIARPDVEDPPA